MENVSEVILFCNSSLSINNGYSEWRFDIFVRLFKDLGNNVNEKLNNIIKIETIKILLKSFDKFTDDINAKK